MKLKKRGFAAILVALILSISLSVNAADASLWYLNIYSADVDIAFNGTTASCQATVSGQDNVTSIQGSMELRDDTTGTLVARWVLSGTRYLNELRTATVTKGHSFTVTYSGFVYAGSTSEYVSKTRSGTCN